VKPLTVERVKALLDFSVHPLRWKIDRQGHARAGDIAGRIKPNGYREVKIDGRSYYVHRLVRFLETGKWPVEVDHISGNRDDNRPENLRDANRHLNMQNLRSATARSKSRSLGVTEYRPGRWAAKITVGGKTLYLGSSESRQAAEDLYLAAKRKYHPGCTL
jgi:hypothetical protein